MSDSFKNLQESRKALNAMNSALQSKLDENTLKIFLALNQIFDIVIAVEKKPQDFKPEETTDIGEKGLTLFDNLVYELAAKQLNSEKLEVEQISLVLAQWVIDHGGVLTVLQTVVDGLAHLSNSLKDKEDLTSLLHLITQIVHACSDPIKHDIDTSNMFRPWRILNINRGIVATRTHNLDIMNRVFPELIQALPLDAPGFFKEGMAEMVRLNYPAPVRHLMQEYYNRTVSPPVH
ncbi:MAG: hypothetical protein V3R65_06510 [Acidiferrobacterales bacterium]